MFPLQSALLPGEDLPLRVFEPRYSTLVGGLPASDDPAFGVVLIARGREIGGGDERHDVGALARIAQFADHGAGQYQLKCNVQERFRVVEWLPDDPYPRAVIEEWPDEPGSVGPAEIIGVEDDIWALLETLAGARDIQLRSRDDILGDFPTTTEIGCTRWPPACRSVRRTGTPCWPLRPGAATGRFAGSGGDRDGDGGVSAVR